MRANPDPNSLKGHVFTEADLPESAARRVLDAEKNKAWLDRQTERYKIVAWDGDYPIIAEELQAYTIARHDKADERALVGTMMQFDHATRIAVLDAFDEHGNLIIPFALE